MCAAALSATAQQQLTKEVVIDREVEPVARTVSRPSLTAGLFTVPVKTVALRQWEYDRPGDIRRQLTRLEPASYADTFAISPYRGYASIGYLPTYNLGVSAGYRFLNTDNTQLGAWLNYSGHSYNVNPANFLDPTVSTDNKVSLASHTFDLGVDLSHHAENGDLTADARFTYGSIGQPMYEENFTQNVTGFGLNLDWAASTKAWPWHVGASFNTFGYGEKTPGLDSYSVLDVQAAYTPTPVREYIYGLNGGLAKKWGNSEAGVDLDFTFQHVTSLNMFTSKLESLVGVTGTGVITAIDNLGDDNFNVLRFAPYYKYVRPKYNVRLGLNVDVITGFESTTRIAPNVYAAWTPTQQFAVWAKIDAPTQVNSLRTLYNYSPYLTSQFAVSPSLINYDGRVGVTVGPFSDIAIRAWIGYSDADFTPVIAATDKYNYFMGQQNGAFAYGADVTWNYRSIFSVYAAVEGAQNDDDNVYYRWLDKAKWDVKAGFSLRPIEKLNVGVDWNLRTGRHGYMVDYDGEMFADVFIPTFSAKARSLGVMNNLSLNAKYSITDAFSVFANVENLMCRRWQMLPGVESARLHGLVGVSYKF